MKIVRLVSLGFALILLAISTIGGLLMNYLYLFLLASAVITLVSRIAALVQKRIEWGIWQKKSSMRGYLIQALLRNSSWILIGTCIAIALIPIQFSPDGLLRLKLLIWGSVFVLCILAWLPERGIGKSLNITLSIFSIFLISQLFSIYQPLSPGITLQSPFQESWYVVQGGNSPLINHHYFVGSQKYALDLIVSEDGTLPLEQVRDLAEYQSFDRDLFSPVNGTVVEIRDDLPDLPIGEFDRQNLAGNHIVIQTEDNFYILLAHLKQESIVVAEGDTVKAGEKIGKCGNSGNTSQPHLHLQAMTQPDFLSPESQPVPISFKIDDTKPQTYRRNKVLAGLSS